MVVICSAERAGYLRSPTTKPPSDPSTGVRWRVWVCVRGCAVTQSVQSPLATMPPTPTSIVWMSYGLTPRPPMRPPPVLCSHKALHYHRAWRDGEALKSGVWRREGGRCGTEKEVGGGVRVDLLSPTTARLWVMLLRDPRVYPVSPLSAPNT